MWAGLTPAILQQPNNQQITPQHMAAPLFKAWVCHCLFYH
jgi:hypothetical protein